MRRPWWLFYGVARESPRMRYYTDLQLLWLAVLRGIQGALAEVLQRQAVSIRQAGEALSAALGPAFQRASVSFRQCGEAFNRSRSLS